MHAHGRCCLHAWVHALVACSHLRQLRRRAADVGHARASRALEAAASGALAARAPNVLLDGGADGAVDVLALQGC